MKAEVLTIFPTPLYVTNINREYTIKEKKEVEKLKKQFIKNNKNNQVLSIEELNDSYILERPVFKNIKNFILENLKTYIEKVLMAYDVEPYITQSWITVTTHGMVHPTHRHPNSFLSGTLYMYDVTKEDSVVFNKFIDGYYIRPNVKSFNFFNSETFTMFVEPGKLLIFPSHIPHHVTPMKGTYVRTSIAFNSFLKGNLGLNKQLNRLILK
jgi:uncharacterized protein (TIGR02466 family)